MFGFKNPIEYSNLKTQIEKLKAENENLAYANKVYQDQLVDEMSKASFSVDWNAMNAFSVERGWNNGTLRTTIGYMLQEPAIHTEGEEQKVTFKDVVREWVLNCSSSEHERLVKEFNAYVKGKNK